MNTFRTTFFPALLLGGVFAGCASAGHINSQSTSAQSARPEIVLHRHDWKEAAVAIASYNLSKGRELDRTMRDRMVLYEGVRTEDGEQRITSKIIYSFLKQNDGLVISSTRFRTDDLDDDSASEALDQASLDVQQQELQEIAKTLDEPVSVSDVRSQ